jgi:hypothetical protein
MTKFLWRVHAVWLVEPLLELYDKPVTGNQLETEHS